MSVISNIKDGLKMSKDKVINTIANMGKSLKNKENRMILGIVLGGLSASLILSCYVKIPQ